MCYPTNDLRLRSCYHRPSVTMEPPTLCSRCLCTPWGPRPDQWGGYNNEKGEIDSPGNNDGMYFSYHISYADIKASADASCWWCLLLYDEISGFYQARPPVPENFKVDLSFDSPALVTHKMFGLLFVGICPEPMPKNALMPGFHCGVCVEAG